MIADNIIDRHTNRKGHTTVNSLPVDLFGEQLLSLRGNDRVTKLAKINNLGTRDTLSDKSLQSQIDNLGSFLVLGAYITWGSSSHPVQSRVQPWQKHKPTKVSKKTSVSGLASLEYN